MSTRRRIAILIDGAFFLKRLPKIAGENRSATPEGISNCIHEMCRSHVQQMTGDQSDLWRRHIYRIFYYDAPPYEGKSHHPLLNRPIDFSKSDVADFKRTLFKELCQQPKLALRRGKVILEHKWSLPPDRVKKLLATRAWFAGLDFSNPDISPIFTEEQRSEAIRLQKIWSDIKENDVSPGFRQKGVDMRIGLDIASITLKKQAETIILIAGDSDFVPAAKLARREGLEFILDPLWQNVNPDLIEHIDGLQSGLPKPNAPSGTNKPLSKDNES